MTRREPSYILVARDLRQRLASSEFGADGRLPTEAALSAEYAVSRQTIRRAFQGLVHDGLVDRTRGRGTFATLPGHLYVRQMGSIEDLMGLSDDTNMEVVRPLTRAVDVAAAGRLKLDSDSVVQMEFVRIHDDVRFCLTRLSLPAAAARLLTDVRQLHVPGAISDVTVIGLLDRKLDSPIAEAHQSVTVEAAPADIATELRCATAHPMLRVDRLYLDETGAAVELATSYFLPEHYSYRTRLRRTR